MWMAVKRGIVVAIGLLIQILLTLFIYLKFGEFISIIQVVYGLLSIIIVLMIIKYSKRLSSDLIWILLIMLFPLIGTLLYIILSNNMKRSKVLKNINENIENGQKYLIQDEFIKKEIDTKNLGQLKYISEFAGFPVTKNNEINYYSLGDDVYPVMLEELKKAKKFIFIEYFIINNGTMWQEILDILKEKANSGLDVRVLYDDMGSFAMLPSNYPKLLGKYGIKCMQFNKLSPFAGIIMNNRDHRKMMIIDGHTAFSGGINISDEYININSKLGVWKDNGIRIKGEAVWNFTVMFLEMWNSFKKEDNDYNKYKYNFTEKYKENGFVVPYGESPLDDAITGEDIYLNIINQAKKYVYIYTPYLIIDTDMINSLILAARRGVDVRIVVPGIPDKKIVYDLTSSYFYTLIKGGVKIYTYTNGFVHSKVFLSDDEIATVGTINLDYRSLYLHFECGIYMKDTNVIKDIKKDFEDSFKESHKVDEKEAKMIRRIYSLYASGEYGLSKISKILYEEGYKTKKGDYIHITTLRRMITNPKYKGFYCTNTVMTKDYRNKKQIRLEDDWYERI